MDICGLNNFQSQGQNCLDHPTNIMNPRIHHKATRTHDRQRHPPSLDQSTHLRLVSRSLSNLTRHTTVLSVVRHRILEVGLRLTTRIPTTHLRLFLSRQRVPKWKHCEHCLPQRVCSDSPHLHDAIPHNSHPSSVWTPRDTSHPTHTHTAPLSPPSENLHRIPPSPSNSIRSSKSMNNSEAALTNSNS